MTPLTAHDRLRRDDLVQIDGEYAVHPITGHVLDLLQYFLATHDQVVVVNPYTLMPYPQNRSAFIAITRVRR